MPGRTMHSLGLYVAIFSETKEWICHVPESCTLTASMVLHSQVTAWVCMTPAVLSLIDFSSI